MEAFAGANGLRANCMISKKARRKLNSPVGCSPGRAAKGASPVTSTKNRRSAFAGLRFFAVATEFGCADSWSKAKRSRGKGSRADAKADAWEKGEQALFCQRFPDRARTLPRETNKPPGQAARNAAAGFAALFRRRGSWVPPSPRPSLLHEKSARQKTMKNNAFFMVFCYFDFEEEKYGSYSIVLGKLMLEYK